MADEPKIPFGAMPLAVGPDDRLHALDLRALAVIAYHDRMSIHNGGAGCYVEHKKLAALLGVDVTRFSKSLKRLADFGYVQIERRNHDRRFKTVRVIYSEDSCHGRQQSQPGNTPEIVATEDNYQREIVDTGDNETGEIVDIRDSETRTNPPKIDAQYIPLKGEKDFVETSERYSVETARLDACGVDAVSSIRQTFDHETALSLWNEVAGRLGLPTARTLTGKRLANLKAAVKAWSLDDWLVAMQAIADSDLLQGKKGNWQVTLDWLIKPNGENFAKVIDGNYDNGPAPNQDGAIQYMIGRRGDARTAARNRRMKLRSDFTEDQLLPDPPAPALADLDLPF